MSRNRRSEVASAVTAFRTYRERVWAHAHAGMTHDEAMHLATMLDFGLFALAVPTSHRLQSVMDDTLHHSEWGIFENQSRVLANRLVNEATQRHSPRSRLTGIHRAAKKFVSSAIDVALPIIWNHRALSAVAEEHAEYRIRTDLLLAETDAIPRLRREEIVAKDMRRGTNTGMVQEMRLIDVLLRTIPEHGLTADPADLTGLAEGRLLRALARQKGVSAIAFDRIASGCLPECYDDDDATVRSRSPHRQFIRHYPDISQFRKHHWHDTWFETGRFSMFRTKGRAELGLSFSLAAAQDPMNQVAVSDARSRRPRMGCPVLQFDGIEAFAVPIAEMCAHPAVFEPLAEQGEQWAQRTDRTLTPAAELNRRLFVPETYVATTGRAALAG